MVHQHLALQSLALARGLAHIIYNNTLADGVASGIERDAVAGVRAFADALELPQYLLAPGAVLLCDGPDAQQRVHELQYLLRIVLLAGVRDDALGGAAGEERHDGQDDNQWTVKYLSRIEV